MIKHKLEVKNCGLQKPLSQAAESDFPRMVKVAIFIPQARKLPSKGPFFDIF
jgi:hypothetical protein